MARPKAFDLDEALEFAVHAFGAHGFAGTSTDMLLRAMEINRQSLYDTFGDKRALYLRALRRYARTSVSATLHALDSARSPRQGIEAAFEEFVRRPAAEGCLGVGSVCEFGSSDEDVNVIHEAAGEALLAAFERRLEEARTAGKLAADLEPRATATFLVSTLAGLRLSARGGATTEQLRAVARIALRCLD